MSNSSISKSPTKPLAGTLRHQKSRVLGRASDSSLHSKFNNSEQTTTTTAVEPQSGQESAQPSTQLQSQPQSHSQAQAEAQAPVQSNSGQSTTQQKTITSSDSWSIWPRKSQVQGSDAIRPPREATKSPHGSIASIKSEGQDSKLKDDASIHSASIPEKKERENSWISWRKPSFTSMRKAVEQAQEEEQQQQSDDQEIADSTDDPVKSVANDSIPNANQKDRAPSSSSWSFWNNTITSNRSNSLSKGGVTNVLLAGGDALLFEPSEINESETQTPNLNKKKSTKSLKQKIPNKVVPGFEKSLPLYSARSNIINNVNRLRYTLGFEVQDPKHLYRTQTLPSTIKKVLIVGVHGFFPTKVLRPLIGEPTGTSIKFANEAEKAIHRWAHRENLDIIVQKIALEREGKIFDRVDFFYDVMKKWIKDIQDSDYIYFAAHSQGCPVSIILLGRLINDGVIKMDNNKRISVLAMAGVNNGPFYGVDQKLFVRAYSTIENDSLMELFQFQNFESVHSKEFLKNMKIIVENNVKITFVGSVNDQLVPLYSSTCLHVRHPNIFRATYVDGSSNTPGFVTQAVSIANHLHNIGLSDHGLIKEISNSLAGPLTGGGHSKIYNDAQVYDLALNFSLYTNDLKYQIPLHFKPYSIEQLGVNPYHLPWCMRGLLFETKANLPPKVADEDIKTLFEEFEQWNPETKQLKDMKYRLNGIKSKL